MKGQEASDERPAVRPLTRAERSGYRETSRYADVTAFLDSLETDSPALQVLSFGYSQEGRSLLLVGWDPGLQAGPAADAASLARGDEDRVRVLVLANIHAGEVAGKEATLILLRELGAAVLESAQLELRGARALDGRHPRAV